MPRFLENNQHQLLPEINALLDQTTQACFAVAFVRESGVRLLLPAMGSAIARGASVAVLFGADWALSEANAIRELVRLGVSVKCYRSRESFHPKGYVFRLPDQVTAIVGSSNLSASGLTSGREWNIVLDSGTPVMDEFERLWHSERALSVTDDLLRQLDVIRPTADFQQLIEKEDQPEQNAGPSAASNTLAETPIRFTFTVNASFRSYDHHPITVPRGQVSYSDLQAAGLDEGSLSIAFEETAVIQGFMQSATAGFGLYFQIRISGPYNHPLFLLPIGTRLNIELKRRSDGDKFAYLARA